MPAVEFAGGAVVRMMLDTEGYEIVLRGPRNPRLPPRDRVAATAA